MEATMTRKNIGNGNQKGSTDIDDNVQQQEAMAAAGMVEDEDDGGKGNGEIDKVVMELVVIGLNRSALWHNANRQCFASNACDDHLEHYNLDQEYYQDFLANEYGKDHKMEINGVMRPIFPKRSKLVEATYHLKNHARCADLLTPRTRINYWQGQLWLDLGRKDWSGVCITADGWQLVSRIAAPMTRDIGMGALPIPVKGGNIADLRPFVHVRDDEDFVLICGTTAALLCPFGDYVTSILCGPAGSGKTTATLVMRGLVDPNTIGTRPLTTVRNLMIGASNTHIIALENVGDISDDESDAICRLNTGTGYAERQLYTNNKEFRSSLHCPVLINGIPGNLAEREDLADRIVTFRFDLLGDATVSKDNFWRRFNAAAPALLGVILDGVVDALRVRRDFADDSDEAAEKILNGWRTRFVDYVLWAECCCRAMGFEPGAFTAAYRNNKNYYLQYLAEHDPICVGIKGLLDKRSSSEWRGYPDQLYKALLPFTYQMDEHDRKEKLRGPSWLAREDLARAIPLLTKVHGIKVQMNKRLKQDDNSNGIIIERRGKQKQSGKRTLKRRGKRRGR
jgi:putative DNA primase/helicase